MKTRLKIFWILWISSVIASILIVPYLYSVQGEILTEAGISYSLLFLVAAVQGGIIFGIAAFLGLILAEKTGFNLPLITAFIEKRKIDYKNTFWLSVVLGLIVGAVIVLLDLLIFSQGVMSEFNVRAWQAFLASFYGGIAEEILMRLFLMSLFVFVFMKISGKKKAGSVIVWTSIILVSILFGLGHLPITSSVVGLNFWIVLRAIVLNGVGGIVFGWLYWKKGLESAIIAHFFADIVLHVIVAGFLM